MGHVGGVDVAGVAGAEAPQHQFVSPRPVPLVATTLVGRVEGRPDVSIGTASVRN